MKHLAHAAALLFYLALWTIGMTGVAWSIVHHHWDWLPFFAFSWMAAFFVCEITHR